MLNITCTGTTVQFKIENLGIEESGFGCCSTADNRIEGRMLPLFSHLPCLKVSVLNKHFYLEIAWKGKHFLGFRVKREKHGNC